MNGIAPTRRAVVRNGIMAAAQVVVLGLSLFVLYRIVLRALGIERLGVWSLVLATTSVGRLSQLGIGHGVVRYVSRALGRGERDEVLGILDTALVSTAALAAAAVLALYPVARWFVSFTVPPELTAEAFQVLPWALASLCLALVGGVLESGLDGLHRMDLRTLPAMATTIVYVVLAAAIVPARGLRGLAEAQLVQAVLSLVTTRALLATQLPGLRLLPRRFSWKRLRELLGFGVAVQATTVGVLLLDPLAKALLARIGTVAAVGWYEMAIRMVMQLRALAASAGEALVPAMSHLSEQDRGLMRAGYVDATRAMFFLVPPATAATLVIVPLVSELWIGAYQPEFAAFAYVLSLALLPTLVAVPAYYGNIALGRLRPNTAAVAVMLASTGILGWALRGVVGPLAVALGYGAGALLGHALMVAGFQGGERVSARAVVPARTGALAFAATASAAAGLLVYFALAGRSGALLRAAAVLAAWAAVMVPAVWRHPLRRELVAWLAPGPQRAAK